MYGRFTNCLYNAVNLGSAVNPEHPLNRGRACWYLTPPGVPAAGTRLIDLCGKLPGTLNGFVVGDRPWVPDGRGGSAMNCSGTGYVACAGGTTLDVGTGDMAVAGWVSWTSTTSAFPFNKRTSSGAQGYEYLFNSPGSGNAIVRITGNVQWNFPSGLNDGVARRFVATRINGVYSTYVNAQLANTGVDTANLSDTAAPLNIGGRNGTAFAACTVGDLSIWPTRGLTLADVQQDFRLSSWGYKVPDSPLQWAQNRTWSFPTGGASKFWIFGPKT